MILAPCRWQPCKCNGSMEPSPIDAAKAAGIDIDYVYNTMPPKQGPVYPPEPLVTVTDF